MNNIEDTRQDVQEDVSEQMPDAQTASGRNDDSVRDGTEGQNANKIELTREEYGSILEAVTRLTEIIKSQASQYLDRVEEAFKLNGKTLDDALELIASQKGWNGKSYGGVHHYVAYDPPFYGIILPPDPRYREYISFGFAGGFQEYVFGNLLSQFRIGASHVSVNDPKPFYTVAALALKKAMAADARLKKFIEAVARATKIVGGEKEYEMFKLALGDKA